MASMMMMMVVVVVVVVVLVVMMVVVVYLLRDAGILYYVSSTLNPILYSVMSHRYRRALHDTLCSSNLSGQSSRRPNCLRRSDEDSVVSTRGYPCAGRAACSIPLVAREALGTGVEITTSTQRLTNETRFTQRLTNETRVTCSAVKYSAVL